MKVAASESESSLIGYDSMHFYPPSSPPFLLRKVQDLAHTRGFTSPSAWIHNSLFLSYVHTVLIAVCLFLMQYTSASERRFQSTEGWASVRLRTGRNLCSRCPGEIPSSGYFGQTTHCRRLGKTPHCWRSGKNPSPRRSTETSRCQCSGNCCCGDTTCHRWSDTAPCYRYTLFVLERLFTLPVWHSYRG